MRKAFAKLTLALALAGAALSFGAGTAQANHPCGGGGICPAIYAPVICNDGVVYGNDCYAREACAHGCRPYKEEI